MADWVEDSFSHGGPPKNPNYSFEYRHINHVEPKANYESEDEFKQSIIDKYAVLDAKKPDTRVSGRRIPANDLRLDHKELRAEIRSANPRSIHAIPENPMIEGDRNE